MRGTSKRNGLAAGVAALAALAVLAVMLGGCVESPGVGPPDKDPFGPLDWMISPTQGRPALVKVASQFPVRFRVPGGFSAKTGRVEFRLVDSIAPDRTDGQGGQPGAGGGIPLKLVGGAANLDIAVPPPAIGRLYEDPTKADAAPAALAAPSALASGLLAVPDSTPPGLYDLVIALYDEKGASTPTRTKAAPRGVAVYSEFPASFRFVQLSNMNIGSVTAPAFSDELVEEVNRIAPAFIITTGDYTELAVPAAARRDPAGQPGQPGQPWRAVKQYFARFDAPVFLMVGDLDDEPSFHQFVAPSASGRFTFGRCQGILLYDTYHHPIDASPADYRWLDSILSESAAPDVLFNFLVSPDDSLRVFDAWKALQFPASEDGPDAGGQPGQPEKAVGPTEEAVRRARKDYVLRHRIGMIFVGGYSDWDFHDYADKLAGTPVHYIRTHASSTCIRGKATGVPHYRIVQVDQPPISPATAPDGPPGQPGQPGQSRPRVALMVPENGAVQHALHSVPVGQIQVNFDGPNNGSAERIKVTVLNRLTIPVPQLRVKVNLKPGLPWASKASAGLLDAVGGTIERVIDRPGRREVWLRIDCPDLGAASAIVGPAESLPRPRNNLNLRLLGDEVLEYHPARAADGFGYFGTDGKLLLQMINTSAQPMDISPVVRLGGNVLTLTGALSNEPIRLMPNENRTLPINTWLALAAPGEHWLTVHLSDDPVPLIDRKSVRLLVTEPSPGPPVHP